MRPLAALFAVGLICAAPAARADDPGSFTLDDAWEGHWRRIFDRRGRADSNGPLLQHLGPYQYPEYEMDLAASGFLLADEAKFAAAPASARLRVQSINEFTLAEETQLRARAGFGEAGFAALRLDRRSDRAFQSTLVTFSLGHDAIAGLPLFVRLDFFPRWEKEDSDLNLVVGARHADWGEVRLRLAALDPFIDASYALAEGRDLELSEHLDQQGAPLALAIELQSARFFGVRFELYGGRVLSAPLRVWHPESPDEDFRRDRSAWLGAGLVEWRPAEGPVTAGISVEAIRAQFSREGDADPTRDVAVDEASTRARGYVLAALPGPVRLEAAVQRTVEEGWLDNTIGAKAGEGGDVRWLSSARAIWMPSTVVGLEVGLMRSDRSLIGPPGEREGGSDHRLLTRCALQLGPKVHITFGIGWDLDPSDGRYDGGGLTLRLND